MISRSFKILLIALVVVGSAKTAFAGAVNSGGGKAIVCRDHRNRILSVETLDLWEAREILNLKVPKSTASADKQIESMTARLKNLLWSTEHSAILDNDGYQTNYVGPDAFANDLLRTAKLFTVNTETVHHLHGKTLTNIPDSLEDAFPNGCLPEQVAIFHDTGTGEAQVIINQDLVDRMNVQNQAALYVHEALYRLLRRISGEGNSLRTRRAVGLAFSGHSFRPIADDVPEKFLACGSASIDDNLSVVAVTQQSVEENGRTTFSFLPVVLQGVFLTDFRRESTGMTIEALNLDDFLNQLVVPPTGSPVTNSSGFTFGFSNAVIDLEVTARFEIITMPGHKFALAITRTVSPWSPTPLDTRTFLRCAAGSKEDLFPVGSTTRTRNNSSGKRINL